jgi:predicted nucleotidyltransferase
MHVQITQYIRWLRCKHPTHFGFLIYDFGLYCGAPHCSSHRHFEPWPRICYDTAKLTEDRMIVSTKQFPLIISQSEIEAFCRHHHIRQLALFGSVLRDDFGPNSDVDVLVEFEPGAAIGLLAFARVQRELSELFQRPIDLVTRDGLKPLIKQTVLADAEVIYAV